MTRKEIAKELGITENTVRSTLYSAMSRFRVNLVVIDLIDKGYDDDYISDFVAALGKDDLFKYLRSNYGEVYDSFEDPCYNTWSEIESAANFNGCTTKGLRNIKVIV